MNWAIDVSFWDAKVIVAGKVKYIPVDWRASGLDMAIIKSSEALTEDPAFRIQWAAAKGETV